ncbi:MAG: dephospho-CoA kinase [Pseudomonadota bacterium]
MRHPDDSPGEQRPFVVGVTGGIGSGKSALTGILEDSGIVVVDADLVARDVVAIGSKALHSIESRHGRDILNEDGSLNRPALRKIVFADPTERKWLEDLTHPLIRSQIHEELAKARSPYVVLSSPLLLEGDQKTMVDHVVVVDVPEQLQLERTMRRDSNDEALVRSIMKAQLDRETRLAAAGTVVDNSGSLEDLAAQAEQVHQRLLQLAGADG